MRSNLRTGRAPSGRKGVIAVTGSALFSLFFGAGNITFPLSLGARAPGDVVVSLVGFLLTAVAVPFAGLLAIILFEGNYTAFFRRVGKVPGLLITLLLLALMGPFGGIPRLISLMFSTFTLYLPGMRLALFTPVACTIIFLCAYRKTGMARLIGRYLAPLLVLSLAIIIVKGLLSPPPVAPSPGTTTPSGGFWYGLTRGYQTMDLIASFFFASLVYGTCAKRCRESNADLTPSELKRVIISVAVRSGILGATLLGLVYFGLGMVAAGHHPLLVDIPDPRLFAAIGQRVLGVAAGSVVSVAVISACVTTAIGLTVICAEFLGSATKTGYTPSLLITLTTTGLVTCLEFDGICNMLLPVLEVIYPTLFIVCFFNILHKTHAIAPIKAPVYLATGVCCVIKFLGG
ncbi:MAG: branched-chain amino acid transport system II carrier protein [Simkaniaceae bacterium]|nr:branched-chain amino acid transport system II carrier protein [Simkaniaceae bacterium]